jgi:hypothetical protein
MVTWGAAVLMENIWLAPIHDVCKVHLKFTSKKVMRLQNLHHVPTINQNLVNVSLLCHDGFKIVFGSNKLVVSRFILFISKNYDCGGLFCLSVLNLLIQL